MCGLEVCNSTSLLTVDRLNMLDQVVVTLDRFISISHLNGNSTKTVPYDKYNVSNWTSYLQIRPQSKRVVERQPMLAFLPPF